jgi:Rho GTPase-activating protein 1
MAANVHPHYFTRLPEEFGGKIPFIVTDLVDRLKELKAEETVGIFRLNGSQCDMAEICALLDKGRIKDWSKYSNVNTVANVLKKYFRDKVCTASFFPQDLNSELDDASKIEDEEKQLRAYKTIINKLLPARKLTLAFMVKYLREIEQNSDKNKMTFSNIAIVFAPNLFSNDAADPKAINCMFATMLKGGEYLFDDVSLEGKTVTDEDMKILVYPPYDTTNALELRALRKISLLSFIPGEFIQEKEQNNQTSVIVESAHV